MGGGSRRRRGRLWAGLYVALFDVDPAGETERVDGGDGIDEAHRESTPSGVNR